MNIGIAGAGGLGSNIAMHLIRSGVGNLKIVDFDRIDESNLNRQFFFRDQIGRVKVEALKENLQRIDPTLSVVGVPVKITSENVEELFHDCHIIIEALDKAEYKRVVVQYGIEQNLFTLGASGIAHYDIETVTTKKLRDKLYLVGDFTKDIGMYQTYSTKVSVVAAHMANIVLDQGGFYGRGV